MTINFSLYLVLLMTIERLDSSMIRVWMRIAEAKLTRVWPELVKRMIPMCSNLCEVKVIFVTLGL